MSLVVSQPFSVGRVLLDQGVRAGGSEHEMASVTNSIEEKLPETAGNKIGDWAVAATI